ncbi:hypothetical protein F4778DRAFT_713507 [Xylariomycetidae sp. FL2044]|nr:hypothetical protein F4778DRAFT_713507 [Xylariomycetidae sp. FL2044]
MANRNHYPSETETEPDRESVLGSREDLESHSRTGSETDDRSEDHRQSGDQSQSDSSQPGTRAPTPPAAGPKPFGPGDRVPWFPVPDDVEVLFHPWPSSLPLKCPRPPPGTTSIFPTLDALPECYSPFEDVSSGALFGHNFVGGCQHLITWTRTDLLSRISVDPWPAAFTSLMCLQQGALREITNTLISVWIAKTKEYSPMTEAELQGMFVEMATYAGHGVGDEERIICDGKIAFAFRSVSSRPPQHPKYNRIPGWLCKNTEPLGAKWKVSALWAQPLGLGAEISKYKNMILPKARASITLPQL